MLDEGRRRHERGEDVVVCATQPQYSPRFMRFYSSLRLRRRQHDVPGLEIAMDDAAAMGLIERVSDLRTVFQHLL